MKLSQQSARDMQPGEILRDHVVPGLELHAKARGKSWFVYYRCASGRRRPRIGAFPALQIEAARDAARALLLRVARGEDPSQERQAQRTAPTVNDLCDRFAAEYLPKRKPAYQLQVRQYLDLYVRPAWGSRDAASVRKSDVAALLAKVAAGAVTRPPKPGARAKTGGPCAANKLRAYISRLFSWAELEDVAIRRPDTNPAKGTEKQRERKRRVKIDREAFPKVWRALANLEASEPANVAAIYCILFCGARVSEIAAAERKQFQGGKLVLEEHKTDRTGDVRVVYVPEQAQRIIAGLPISFSGRLFGDNVDRHSIWRVWNLARTAAGCPEIQPRDLRRTFASVARSAGVSLDQVGGLFGHAANDTTEGYAWLFDDAAIATAQRVADEMEKQMKAGTK